MPSGRLHDADPTFKKSLEGMTTWLSAAPEKIFLVQIGDAERPSQPLTKDHPLRVDGQPARMAWSRNGRLFAHDPLGSCYLSIEEICDVIFNQLQYIGWVSCEV